MFDRELWFFYLMILFFIMLGVAVGVVGILSEYSQYKYCFDRNVPYGVCEAYIKESFATQNIKLRVGK